MAKIATSFKQFFDNVKDYDAIDLSKKLPVSRTVAACYIKEELQKQDEFIELLSAELEKEDCSITSINLSGKQIFQDEESIKDFAASLEKNTSVAYLNLSENYIGYVDSRLLAGSLSKNSNLKHLILNNNFISSEAISSLISKNNTITSIKLLESGIYESGALEILEALQANYVITSLEISGSIYSPRKIKDTTYDSLEKALAVNKANLVSTKELILSVQNYTKNELVEFATQDMNSEESIVLRKALMVFNGVSESLMRDILTGKIIGFSQNDSLIAEPLINKLTDVMHQVFFQIMGISKNFGNLPTNIATKIASYLDVRDVMPCGKQKIILVKPVSEFFSEQDPHEDNSSCKDLDLSGDIIVDNAQSCALL